MVQQCGAGNLRSLVAKRKTTEDKVKKGLSILTGVLDYAEFKHVDMVIVAVIGSIPVKQSIFRELEKVCSHNCILASNTSTIDLNVIGEKTCSQERIIGAHFFRSLCFPLVFLVINVAWPYR
ncbi:hypothetical protein C5167_029699 [Papaver somniferum]|nr:hypothetical protein C5167_029699 [Papaver somniferum]